MIQRFNLEQDFTIRWLIETYQDLNLLVNCLESLEVRRPGQLQNLPNSVWPRKDGVFTLPLSARLLLSNEKQGNHKHSLSAANQILAILAYMIIHRQGFKTNYNKKRNR